MKTRLVVLEKKDLFESDNSDIDNYFFYFDGIDSFYSEGFSETYIVKNVLEIIELLKFNHFDLVEVYGGILGFKSEINVRVAISGFLGLASKEFKYFDIARKVSSRSNMLTRIFNSLNVNPAINAVNDFFCIVFSKECFLWRDYLLQKAVEHVAFSMLNVEEFLLLLSNAYENKKPLCYFRVNHCENRLIGQGYSYEHSEIEITYTRQFGYNLSEIETKALSERMQRAFLGADVVGVPSLKPISNNKLNLLENSTYVHFAHFNSYENSKFTTVNLHYDLGVSLGFKEFLKSVDKLYAITGRDVSVLESSLGREIKHLSIPAQYIFRENAVSKRHYPDRFNEIIEFIRNEINPQDVVLIGAGILGKIYCHEVKVAGGIAIDLGSLFDAMVGIDSRGEGFKREFWWMENDKLQNK
jgi:hypothetical protein